MHVPGGLTTRRSGGVAPSPMTQPLYPLRFEPILKRLVWGGRRLGSVLGKSLGEGSDYAESWEVSDHRDDVSRVADGPLAGVTLRDLMRQRALDLIGSQARPGMQFPLLVKYLDAHQVLSVQVHPDDEKGRRLAGDNGKTEAWVVVHAEPGSLIYAGLRPNVSREAFAASLETGTVEGLLHAIPAVAGDGFLIPAGTVHAIGAGVVMAEVQQMSDATFRVWDWGRQPARPLHIPEALESTNFAAGPVTPARPDREPIGGGTRERLAACRYFALERLRLTGPAWVGTPDRFTVLLGLGGRSIVRHGGHDHELTLGQTLLLPASLGSCEVVPESAAALLTCHVP